MDNGISISNYRIYDLIEGRNRNIKSLLIMKRLLLLVTMLSSFTLFAAPWDIKSPPQGNISIWDKPIIKKPLTDPYIVDLYAVSDNQGTLQIHVILDGTPERTMKADVWVRTYRRIGLGPWQWVWMQYIITMEVDSGMPNAYAKSFSVSTSWTYEGEEGSNGSTMLYDNQINLAYYGPQ